MSLKNTNIIEKLKLINYPGFSRDIVSFGMIKDINISDDIINVSDEVVEIPQVGTKHSLNVSVAAGIVLWDFFYKTEI